jgi:isopenicillin N synthase-like dioxygenase
MSGRQRSFAHVPGDDVPGDDAPGDDAPDTDAPDTDVRTPDMIPAIDVAGLNGSAAERRACADRIGWACREIGFFTVVNHGVDLLSVRRTFDVATRFFAAPVAEKMKVALSAESGFCGYFPLKAEVTDPLVGGDPKEGYDISFGPENRWPETPPDLRSVLTEYYATMSILARDLSRGFALALDLAEDFFAAKLDRPTAILRLLHYPPVEVVPDPRALPPTGCGAHSDYGYLTILAQDEQGGLQVETQVGRWVNVPPLPGAFVCNIGEMMARWTNNRFRATPHRVIRIAPGSRYSIPFFFHPNPDVLIETLPSCRDTDGAIGYAPVTSGEYLHRRQSGAYV